MAGINATGQPDYTYQAQLKAQQDAEAAAAARYGQNAGTQAGEATKAQWQIAHPGQLYGATSAADQTASLETERQMEQQMTQWQQQNQMGDLAIQRARQGLINQANLFGSSSSLLSGYNGATSGGGFGAYSPPVSSYTPINAQPASHVTLNGADTSGANANAFARAKDQVGLQTRGALTGLAGAMAGRGTVGSGVEGRGQMGIVNQGQQQLGDVSRQQAITGSTLAQQNAETAYQGDIAQRGQDISSVNSMNQGMLAARGQDISAYNAQAALAQQAEEAQAQRALQALLAQYNASTEMAFRY